MRVIIVLKWTFILLWMFIGAIWFYGPMFLGGDPNVQMLGSSFLLLGGIYCFYKIGVFKKNEIKKGEGMLKELFIIVAGILIFLYSLSQSHVDGYPAFWTGMIISSIGMFIVLCKILKKL